MNHYFDVDVATKYSVNIAIFLNNLAHWTVVNIANRNNYHDFRYWTYNSRRAFLELFPYWTEDQLRTIISNSIKANLVIEGQYNKKAYDKTKWYSLSDEALILYKINPVFPTDENDHNPRHDSSGIFPTSSPEPIGQNPRGFCGSNTEQSGYNLFENTSKTATTRAASHVGEIPNRCGKNPQPIPDSKPDKKHTTTTVDQILSTTPHSEPVVVFSTSLTSTPKVNPLNPVSRMEATTDRELLAAYRAKPFLSINILTETDFLSACDHLIADRGDIPLRGRIKGIVGLIMSSNFDEPPEWAKEQRNRKNRAKGEAQTRLNEEHAIKNAPMLTTAKGQAENLKEIMEKIGINREQTTKKPCFPAKEPVQLPNRVFKSLVLADQIDENPPFEFDMTLVIPEKEAEEDSFQAWEARL